MPPTSPISPPTDTWTPFGLGLADERGDLGAQRAVQLLLLDVRGLVEIDERRGVDVDVVEAGLDRLGRQVEHGLHLGLRIRRVALGVDLEVVTLDEHGAAPAFAERRGQEHERVLERTLVGVRDLGTRDLDQHGAGVERLAGAEQRARGVVRDAADVDGRHGERRGHFATAAGHVEVVDRGRVDADALAVVEHALTGGVTHFAGAEDAGPHEAVEGVHVVRDQNGDGLPDFVDVLQFETHDCSILERPGETRRNPALGPEARLVSSGEK
ncbi:MAG: hypothetical protein IPJ04_14740 [Candidatus Eisenbacteria bacterium]|nr:hypothetical protein [Candidatus Eisenbacteria bacterium]